MTWQITDLFVQFSLLNFVAFGGVTAMLPEIHRLVVEQRPSPRPPPAPTCCSSR